MTEQEKKALAADEDGLVTYEYIANHVDSLDDEVDDLVDNMIAADRNGQFMVSAARYLHAIDADRFGEAVNRLVAAAIDRDRERRYIGDLLDSLYGPDYRGRADELSRTDDNFRRIYKRVYPEGSL